MVRELKPSMFPAIEDKASLPPGRPNLPLLVMVGPTAVGKTALSLRLASAFKGEIVSADSRLLYRGMDVGTAKPTLAERAQIVHHLIDVCDPDETLTLAQYQRMAYEAIDAVHAKGHLPILTGGTGQYVKSVVEGWGIPEVAPRSRLRAALFRLGRTELARWLGHLDPEAATKLDPRNVRRVVRALEVTLVKGQPISLLQRKSPQPYSIKIIGLIHERELLYRSIDMRVDRMISEGLLAEVETLREKGYHRSLPAMSALGYSQLWAYLSGELTFAEAVDRIKFETHRLVRQQATWFRQDDTRISWFHVAEPGVETDIMRTVEEWLGKVPADLNR